MRKRAWFLMVVVLALMVAGGCATFEDSVDVSAGREALVLGNDAKALMEFQLAAKLKPDYVTTFTEFPENIWTYVGRSYYGLGELAKAREALERSVKLHPKAILGHIYLGIVLMRQGQIQPGREYAATGLNLLHNWFKTLDATDENSCYWDPGNVIRNDITSLTKVVNTEAPFRLASRLNRLGVRMEQEINLSYRDIGDSPTEGC